MVNTINVETVEPEILWDPPGDTKNQSLSSNPKNVYYSGRNADQIIRR